MRRNGACPWVSKAAFTLLEVVVVVGLIALLAGGLGLAFKGGERAVALRAGQETLAGLVARARGQAAVSGRNAGLLVLIAPDRPGDHLRRFIVATRCPVDGSWIPTDAWVTLPAGIALLPPATPAGALVGAGDDWSGLRSQVFSSTIEACDGESCHALTFTPRGTLAGLGGALILAPTSGLPPGAGAPHRYEQPEAVRGLLVSSYGQVTFVETRNGF
jgi:type II secretory pathway pseudopilin PulG